MSELPSSTSRLPEQHSVTSLKRKVAIDPDFVERIRGEVEARDTQAYRRRHGITLEGVVERVCQAVGVRAEEVAGGGRRAGVSRARAGVAYLWLEWLDHSGPGAARLLGLMPQTIYEARQRAGGNRRRRIGSKSSKFSHNLHSRATSPSRQDGWLMPRRRWAGGIARYRPLNSGGRFSIKAWADSRKSSVRCNPKPPV